MKISLVLPVFFSSLCFASPIALDRRATNYQTVIADLKVVKTDLISLENAVKAFHGGGVEVVQAEKILAATNKLSNQLNQTISDVKASPPFGKESTKVAVAVTGLEPTIASTLSEIIKKKPAFDKAILGVVSLSSEVLSNLKKQKKQADELGAALLPKLSKTLRSEAPIIQKEIDQKFKQAIKVYKGSSIIGRD